MGSKKTLVLWIVAVAVIAVVVVGVVVARSGNNDNSTSTSNNSTASSNSNPSSSDNSSDNSNAPQAEAADKVTIANMAFSPAAIKVKVGTTVTWTNNDSVAHSVMADNGNGPDNSNLDPGQSYSFTYKSVGTFSYHCVQHPYMTGTVQVTE